MRAGRAAPRCTSIGTPSKVFTVLRGERGAEGARPPSAHVHGTGVAVLVKTSSTAACAGAASAAPRPDRDSQGKRAAPPTHPHVDSSRPFVVVPVPPRPGARSASAPTQRYVGALARAVKEPLPA